MPKESSITVSAVVDPSIAERIRVLRVEGPNIYTSSAVLRAAIIRGIAQLEHERSLGRTIMDDPLPHP